VDPSTLDLISYLAQRTDSARLLILATYRPLEVSGRKITAGPFAISAPPATRHFGAAPTARRQTTFARRST
jgi:hypothetical protein